MTRRRTTAAVVALAAALGLAGTLPGCSASPHPAGPSAEASPPVAVPERVHPDGFHSTHDLVAVPAPDQLRIPAIGVVTGLDRLQRLADGTLQVPSRWAVAGWYEGGSRPGQPGPAAILGHVDSTTGPAVFARLHELRPGDDVLVDAGQRTLRFSVTGLEQVPKDHFPTEQVYLPTLDPVLRLITCGGAFDRSTGHYTDNVIVSAELVPST